MISDVPERQHEVVADTSEPVPLSTVLPSEAAVDAPVQCWARAHTEFEGRVVRWGTDHRVETAAECCDACSRQAAATKNEADACNVWVFCGHTDLCDSKFGQCWLKHTPNPTEPISRGSGLRVPWTSGAVLSKSPEQYKVAHYVKVIRLTALPFPETSVVNALCASACHCNRVACDQIVRTQRAAAQQSELTILQSAEMLIGMRNETGTIELLTPHSDMQPHFSFTLPLADRDVQLGRGQFLDRRADGFHHLGDVTLRVAQRGASDVTCSTVAMGQVAAAGATAGAPGTIGGNFGRPHRDDSYH